MTFDLNFTITGIIALSAIVSPIIVAVINNRFQVKMHKVDIENKLKQELLSKFILSSFNFFGERSYSSVANYYHDLNNLYAYFKIDDSLLDEIEKQSQCGDVSKYNNCVRTFVKTLAKQINTK